MRKKCLATVMAVVLSVAGLTACGSGSSTTATTSTETTTEAANDASQASTDTQTADSTEAATDTQSTGDLLASIKESGKLVIGTASGYPPYEFVDVTSANQDVIGIDIELAQAIADELGVELVIQDMTFSSLLSSIPAHKIDLAIAGISPTDERKETMDFSDNYLTAEQKILVLTNEADQYKTLEDFAGKAVAAEKSTTQEALAKEKLTSSTVTSLEKVPDCILELQNGKIAGIVVESIVGQQYVDANSSITFSDASFDAYKYSAIALEKGNGDLLEIVNKVIKENQDNGNFDKWLEEYSKKAAENAE